MTIFKEMKTEDAFAALEGLKDVLSEESDKFESLYRSKRCHRCHSELTKEFSGAHAFSDSNSMIGRALLRCSICGYLMDPFSGLVLEVGDPSKAQAAAK